MKITIHNPQKMSFQGEKYLYEILGQLSFSLDSQKMRIRITEGISEKKHQGKLDFFDENSRQNLCKELSEKNNLDGNLLDLELSELANELEAYIEAEFDKSSGSKENESAKKELTPSAEVEAIEFLKQKNLFQELDKLIEKSGIVGEEDARKVLFTIASSYKMPYTMHALVQGSSGSGKSHLVNGIMQCMPQEDIKDITRISGKGFYHYGESDLMNKLMVIQDYTGLGEEAQYALRELQSSGKLVSLVPTKDKLGEMKSMEKIIRAHFASLMATTEGQIYFDNMSRSICLSVDESVEQTQRIVEYYNQGLTGKVSKEQQNEAKQLLRNIIRVLKPYRVINQYAEAIQLPMEAKMQRRLNSQFQSFIAQVTLLHQHQRKTDKQGRLIATKEDIKTAIDVFFTSIVLKMDELDGSCRQFFENLKDLSKKGTVKKTFTPKDLRAAMNLERTRVFEQLKTLHQLEYIKIVGGSSNKGFEYELNGFDYMDKKKKEAIKTELYAQVNKL